jgi:hypothetical protein
MVLIMTSTPSRATDRRRIPGTGLIAVLVAGFGVFGLAALVFAALGGGLAGWLIGGSFLATALLLGGSMLAMARIQRQVLGQFGSAVREMLPVADETLRETGAAGTAVVTGLDDTGTTLNDNPVVRFTVRVTPADGGPDFSAEFTRLVSRISVPRKGDHCPVRFDPADRSRILPIGDFAGPIPS